MFITYLLTKVPHTVSWNTNVAIVMMAANLTAIFIGRFAIKNPGSGPDLPIEKPALWKNYGFPELLATMSFGHILGVGLVLGMANAGLL